MEQPKFGLFAINLSCISMPYHKYMYKNPFLLFTRKIVTREQCLSYLKNISVKKFFDFKELNLEPGVRMATLLSVLFKKIKSYILCNKQTFIKRPLKKAKQNKITSGIRVFKDFIFFIQSNLVMTCKCLSNKQFKVFK